MTFVDRVKKHFGYLETQYGFKVTFESHSQVRPQTDGAVEYKSDNTVVVIDSETGHPSIWFYRIEDGKKYYIDPVVIYEYLNTSDKEKKLLLSTDPKDQPAALVLFNQKFLLNQPEWKGNKGTAEDLEKGLENFANWLKKHAKLCIEGDFSRWPKFYGYKIQRLWADCMRRGEDKLVYARVKDSDGKYKLIREPLFKNEFEHVEKLKKEFPE